MCIACAACAVLVWHARCVVCPVRAACVSGECAVCTAWAVRADSVCAIRVLYMPFLRYVRVVYVYEACTVCVVCIRGIRRLCSVNILYMYERYVRYAYGRTSKVSGKAEGDDIFLKTTQLPRQQQYPTHKARTSSCLSSILAQNGCERPEQLVYPFWLISRSISGFTWA